MIDLRFSGLWDRIQAQGDWKPVFSNISNAYSQPGRYYHTIRHITKCMSEVDSLKSKMIWNPEFKNIDFDRIEFALWFHDFVYNPKRKDNEKKSAEVAVNVCKNAKLSDSFSGDISKLIMATRHTILPKTLSEEVIADIDLVILASEGKENREYLENIRKEYGHLSDEEWKNGRCAFLKKLIDERPFLYHTNHFRVEYRLTAIENVVQEILRLQKQSK